MKEAAVQRPQPESWRLFIAISLPEQVRAGLCNVQRELRKTVPLASASWTRRECLHLMLRFLGSVQPERVPELDRQLRGHLAGFGEVALVCERLGFFPNARFPRVVWTWVHDAEDRLAILHRRVEEAVGKFAEKPADKNFVGHVTIARPKQVSRTEAEGLAEFIGRAVTRRFGEWPCREVELNRSELSPGGSRYTTLAKIGL